MISKYNWELLSPKEYVVLDIETTGFSPNKGGRIIEIGAVRVVKGQIVDTFSTFVNPEIKIPKKITELTGITNEMVKDAPVIGKVLIDFKKFIGNKTIVAHNAPFDWNRFLVDSFSKVGVIVENKVIDTKELSKLTFPNEKKHNLKDMCERLGLVNENHHRAINDAKVTAKAFIKFLDIHKEYIPIKKITLQEDVSDKANISIKRVKYWQKSNSKRILYQRQYVNLFYNGAFCNAYFDIPTKCWYIKDCNKPVDLNLVESKVLEYLKLDNPDALCQFRN